MSRLGWEEGGTAWQWGCQLWAWEEEIIGEYRNLLYDIVLQPNILGHWVWRHDTVGGCSVRDAYQLLIIMDGPEVDVTSDLIWHNQVSLKVSVLAWRLFMNRLPTKDNLAMRNIIQQDAQFWSGIRLGLDRCLIS
ncbi:hypothetical protein QL285_079314 [Trifolium repens]|jgi:hypothetical protein|nr:hypothetical protein QL285_079314 [Trifolium repens]